ncbi:MAG: hypothetical protein LW875_09385 [Proteobacteria bacterium]|jgi:hypothetical protein|nr:hypothetical protein [Pseudomonadota bacterium]
MKSLIQHPDFLAARQVCEKLQTEKHIAWIAGGAVRDGLLGLDPKDIDIATSATPDEVENLFEKTVPLGKRFGTIQVHLHGKEFEVTTFRKDGGYQDGRHPDQVEFSSPEEDAQRRDFTVNALFYDPLRDQVHDFVGGKKDLRAHLLNAVGDPRVRFQEDHLRILRLYRFQAQLGFEITSETKAAAEDLFPLLKKISGERLWQELLRLSQGEFAMKFQSHQVISKLILLLAGKDFELSLSWEFPPDSLGQKLEYFLLELLGKKELGLDVKSLAQWFKFSNDEKRLLELFLGLQKPSGGSGEWLARAVDFFGTQSVFTRYIDLLKSLPGDLGESQEFKLNEIFQRQGGGPLYKFEDLPQGFPREKASEVLRRVYEIQLEQLIFGKDKLQPFFEMEFKKYLRNS